MTDIKNQIKQYLEDDVRLEVEGFSGFYGGRTLTIKLMIDEIVKLKARIAELEASV